MISRNNFAAFSALLAVLVTAFLIYIELDQYAGYALLLGFASMVLVTPASKEGARDSCMVVGHLVDGVDLSFMGEPSNYTTDVKRCREYFCNLPGQVSKMPWPRAQYLVANWRKSKGLDGGGVPTIPSKQKLFWRKVKAFFLQPVSLPIWLKKGTAEPES
jgi:hypothetical protein